MQLPCFAGVAPATPFFPFRGPPARNVPDPAVQAPWLYCERPLRSPMFLHPILQHGAAAKAAAPILVAAAIENSWS